MHSVAFSVVFLYFLLRLFYHFNKANHWKDQCHGDYDGYYGNQPWCPTTWKYTIWKKLKYLTLEVRSPGRDIKLFSWHFFISLPGDRKSFPQVSKPFPQECKPFPQDKKSFPQNSNSFLQDSKSFPQDTKSFPQVSKLLRHVSKLFPKVNMLFPQVKKLFTQDRKSFPQVTKLFP